MNGPTGALAAGAAAVVAGWFAVALLRRFLDRGSVNRALVYWGGSLVMFCLASAAMFAGEVLGWSAGVYRVFYLFGAALVVPWLAMGTVQISSRDPFTLRVLGATSLLLGLLFAIQVLRADETSLWVIGATLGLLWGLLLLTTSGHQATAGSLALVATYSSIAVFTTLVAPMTAVVPAGELPSAADLFGPFVVGFSRGGSGLGAVLVVVGAATASFRLRGRGSPHLVVGNLLIALGVLIAGLGAVLGDTEGHAIAFAVGVAVMYAGFTRATRLALPTAEAPLERRTPLVVVYTRQDCGLCERAERLAEDEMPPHAELRLVDIDDDPELQRRYNIRVPVVVVDGVEVAEGRVEQGAIAHAARRAREST